MRVSRWGNSLAVRLPKELVENMRLAAGDELAVVAVSKGKIAVGKIDRRAEFLERMKEIRWPAPKGWKFDRDEANER